MRIIRYTQHEFHGPDKDCELPLEDLILDIQYFYIFGVIPPLSVINDRLGSGGGDGGMGSGTSWVPFALGESEYDHSE